MATFWAVAQGGRFRWLKTAFVYMKERRLPYPTFDADNHMYENKDALTKFIPKEFDGVIKYVEINGRTKVAIKDKLSDYIPNPTFNVVAVPGGYGREHGPSAAEARKPTPAVRSRGSCRASTPSSTPSPGSSS